MEKFEELRTAAVEHDTASDKVTEIIECLFDRTDMDAGDYKIVCELYMARAAEKQKEAKLKDAIQVFFAPNEV